MVDLDGPIGAIWFIEGKFFGVFAFEVLVVGGVESGGGGENQDSTILGELHGWFDGRFGADENLMGVFSA